MLTVGISLPLGDTHFADHLRKGPLFVGKGTYQFAKIERALGMVPESKRCVALDVGGHIGLWSRVLAHHFKQVVAFEPLPALHPHFNINTDDCDNVTLVPFAVSDVNGEINIVTVADNSGNGHVLREGIDPQSALVHRTQCVTLDSLNRHDVGLIKIDVEGWELAVIKGAWRTITRDHPAIVVEQKPGNAERYDLDQFAAVELLKTWGYRVAWEKSGDFGMIWEGDSA